MANIYTANTDTQIETLANHIFKDYGAEMGSAIIAKNFLYAILDKKGKKMTAGGLDFTETVITTENTNFGYRSHVSDIPANLQDPTKTLSFEPLSLTGTLVINEKHKRMNQGKAQIRNLLKTLQQQANETIENLFNRQAWDTAPTSGIEPESVPSLVSATPTTGTIGGVSRVTNTWARNRLYSTAISDIGSEAGLATLHSERFQLGGAINDTPDVAITTPTLFGGLYGYMDNKRQLTSDEQMVKLGFENFRLGSALVSYDSQCPSSYFYYLNTKHLFLKFLEGAEWVFEPFSRKGNNLNSTSVFYTFYNLTTNLPSAHEVFTNVSTS